MLIYSIHKECLQEKDKPIEKWAKVIISNSQKIKLKWPKIYEIMNV